MSGEGRVLSEDSPCPGCGYEGIGSAHADDFGGYDCQPVAGRVPSWDLVSLTNRGTTLHALRSGTREAACGTPRPGKVEFATAWSVSEIITHYPQDLCESCRRVLTTPARLQP